jgi:hypothetical protein
MSIRPITITISINSEAWRLALTAKAAQELREEALRDAAKVLHDARRHQPKSARY